MGWGEWDTDSFRSYSTSKGLHPTQKPVALIEELIKTYTNSGDLILDSCAGSCTTAVASINTGRNYICIEKDIDIYNVGKNRVKEYLKEVSNIGDWYIIQAAWNS